MTEWIAVDCPASAFAFRRTDGEHSILFIGNLTAEEVCVTLDTAVPTDAAVILSDGCERPDNSVFPLLPYGFIILSES